MDDDTTEDNDTSEDEDYADDQGSETEILRSEMSVDEPQSQMSIDEGPFDDEIPVQDKELALETSVKTMESPMEPPLEPEVASEVEPALEPALQSSTEPIIVTELPTDILSSNGDIVGYFKFKRKSKNQPIEPIGKNLKETCYW